MYRNIFIPTEHNSAIPFTIPKDWYGKEVKFTICPIGLLKRSKKKATSDIMKYFGAWKSDESAEEIIAEIHNSRTSGKTRILEDF